MMENSKNNLLIRKKDAKLKVILCLRYFKGFFKKLFDWSFLGSNKFSFLHQKLNQAQPKPRIEENLEDEFDDELPVSS